MCLGDRMKFVSVTGRIHETFPSREDVLSKCNICTYMYINILIDTHRDTDETFFVYYESMNRELKTRPIYECRCDERLETKTEESTRLTF